MEEKKYLINDNNFSYDDQGFTTFKIHIGIKENFSCEQNLYAHRCNQIEYQEVTSRPNSCAPETIYFVNSTNERAVDIAMAAREEVETLPEPQDDKTVYFLKES